MELSNITPHQVNFKSQTMAKSLPEVIKDKVCGMDNSEKVISGLTGLGLLGVAGVLIAKGKGHKAKDIIEDNKVQNNVIDATQNIVENVIEVVESKPIQKTAEQIEQENLQEIGNRVSEALEELRFHKTNYSQVRRNAKHNANHTVKKGVQEALNAQLDERRAVEKLVKERIIEAGENSKRAKTEIEAVKHGLSSASGADEINARVEVATEARRQAHSSMVQLGNVYSANPTKRNRKNLQRAVNNDAATRKEYKKVVESAQKVENEIADGIRTKAENRALNMASPNYEQGQIKMAENAQKTTQNAQKREANALVKKAEVYRNQNKNRFANTGVDKLKKLSQNGKNEVEKAAAKIELAARGINI